MEVKIKIGEKFGRDGVWKVKKLLNHGGFGHIYLVKNRKTNKFAALKAEADDKQNGGSAIKIEVSVLAYYRTNFPHFRRKSLRRSTAKG